MSNKILYNENTTTNTNTNTNTYNYANTRRSSGKSQVKVRRNTANNEIYAKYCAYICTSKSTLCTSYTIKEYSERQVVKILRVVVKKAYQYWHLYLHLYFFVVFLCVFICICIFISIFICICIFICIFICICIFISISVSIFNQYLCYSQ